MTFSSENLAELNVFMLYNASNSMEGIKIHKSAEPALVSATRRLFDGGFVTQKDGGYLTHLGIEAAEHAQSLFTMLNAHRDQ